MDQYTYHALQLILGAGNGIRYFNTYHGIPVNYTGKLVDVRATRASCSAPVAQLITMREAGHTFFTNELITGTLKATVLAVDLQKETAELGEIKHTVDPMGIRSLVRVETSQPIPAHVKINESSNLSAQLTELSLMGLAMNVDTIYITNNLLASGLHVQVSFSLAIPGERQPYSITCPAVIRNLLPGKFFQLFRMGVQTHPTPPAENILNRYIAVRQKELLSQLKETCRRETSWYSLL